MAVSLTRLSRWLWGGSKEKKSVVVDGNCDSEWSFSLKESESLKFPVKGMGQRRVKKKWRSREEKRVDGECDVVLVSSDGGGGCLSGSESDDSDWSIGWLEAHGSDFQSDDESETETDSSFAVLVPCYKPGCKEVEGSNNHLLTAIQNLPNEFSSAGNNYMEQWLASLKKI